ncbi:MAG: ParB/RepB/Spo0J family partition protein, partial [Acidobacteriota bacterium]|nr:ParB/RepB/Spo0J family partition protein [Acidobacteriota bacterium]
AGLLKIPAFVREIPDDQILELALVENIQREQLNPMEEAQAYQNLMEETGQTQEQIAERLGKDRSTVANSIRLLKLPPAISRLVSEGKISAGHARALLASGATTTEMLRLAETILEKGWSVREAERQAKNLHREKLPRPPKVQDPNEASAENRLRLALGTKVEIVTKVKNSGEIRIHFYSHEDLMRIFELIESR